ncbi:MAG: prepilin-type N-terminal cleavage/methylation domain-containing protein [Candidatus Omnitrophica bacterium]|nr:prepilin-type N-terminal cleavage/methylation domain-containing protein [Candidatus Omnitrophota bacterium]
MKRAFSLIEVMIAMAILAVGLFGAVRVFPMGLQASHRSELSSRASIVAGRILEELKLKSCAELKEEAITQEGMTLATRFAPLTVPHLVDQQRLKAVELTVTWQQNGRPRSQVFMTYVRCVPS